MKVPGSIRQLYDAQYELNSRLKVEIDRRLNSLKEPRWHYESRVKSLQSFALKLETGRFKNPSSLEDFFACTIVVANALEIGKAENLIKDRFKVQCRRPGSANWTHKRSDSFPFDDLRLYASLGQDPALPETDLAHIVFEVQIKTFLQHAWTIATHDLVYKSDAANWSKERIAYQIKAMLEHAELSIQEAERLAESPVLAKEDRFTADISKCINLLKEHWAGDELPEDVRRLAQNISSLLEAVGITTKRLTEVFNIEKGTAGGSLPLNLSPYTVIVQVLLRYEKEKMQKLLTNADGNIKIIIPSEVNFPADLNRAACCNAIFVGQADR